VQVRLLGPIDVLVDGASRQVRGFRRKAVLSVLALHPGTVVSTDRLISVVWGGTAPAAALNTLQSHVSHLRQVFGRRSAILTRSPGYVLDLGEQSTDVEVAEGLIAQGSKSVDARSRADALQAALELWRGRPLADVASAAWLGEQAQRLDQLWLQAMHALVEARLELGDHAALVPDLQRLTQEHPLDEQIHGQLILALYRANRQADALAAYHRLRQTLGDELGIDPSKSLRDLEGAILRQDPTLLTPHRASGPLMEVARAEPVRLAAPDPIPDTAATVNFVRLGAAALVGRGGELGSLKSVVDAASRGTGGAVFLIGEPGIGKTRLAAETARLGEQLGLTVLRGRAATPAVQFRPLSEALLSILRRSGAPDDPDLLPYRPALSRLVPEWRTDRPAGVDDSLVVLAEGVLRLVIALGRPRGCVLVLEDLHDADPDTLAVVDYLIDNAASERLLVVATARTDPSAALDLLRAAQHRRSATVVELTRLDDDAVRQMAGACLDIHPDEVPQPVLDRLLTTADGVPLHVEELLAGMVSDQVLEFVDGRWSMTGPAPAQIPVSLATTLAGRADRLSPAAGAMLRAAALLGRRFPAVAAGAAAGVDGAGLLACLREAVDAQLLVPQEDPDLYAFRHVLTAEALQARLLPLDRAALSRRAAESVEATVAPSFDGWQQLTGELWSTAGEPRRAAQRLGMAGRRAAEQGALSNGIALLERALSMVDASATDDLAADIGEALVDAYADAGRIGDAYATSARFDSHAAPERQAGLHLRLARVAAKAGDWQQGLREVADGRRLLGTEPDPAVGARMDAVEAELIFGDPARDDRGPAAQRLAQRALDGAEATGQPDVSCSALETLGRCARLRNVAEADALHERGLAIATAHDLVNWKVSLLYQIGVHTGMRAGDVSRLAQALAVANQAGAVVTALNIELEMSVVHLCRAEFEVADAITRRCAETAARLRLTHTRLIALGLRVIVAAHRGQRAEVDALLVRFRELGGEDDDLSTAVRGLGIAFAHLLHEQGEDAVAELTDAAISESRRPTSYLSFIHGPHLLLSVLDGRAGPGDCAALAASAQVQADWNRQFLALSEAILHGRAGRVGDAERAMASFVDLSRPYPLARHLGFRLVAPDAVEHGWGDPVSWLRTAEAYFHIVAPDVARACRTALRRTGAPVPQHRQGSEALPAEIRERGITVREYEVLGLIAERLGNQEISRRLFLSTRTVEKHVGSLLAKAGVEDRGHLVEFAEGLGDG
jgi:DNA-binding SARP family transcriptional activator/DNA-binding CsgD family transcriptional regulator